MSNVRDIRDEEALLLHFALSIAEERYGVDGDELLREAQREIDDLPNHARLKRRILATGHVWHEHVGAYKAGGEPFVSMYRIHPDHSADEGEIPVLLIRREPIP